MPIELSRHLQGLQLTTVEVRGPVLLGDEQRIGDDLENKTYMWGYTTS